MTNMKVPILNLFVNGRHGVQHHVYRPQFKKRLLKLEVILGDICEFSTTAPFGRHFGFVTKNIKQWSVVRSVVSHNVKQIIMAIASKKLV